MNHLVYLRTFLDTYRAGSLTRAAQRLGISQPAASAHIAALEDMLGKPLFLRQARGVAPTAAAGDLARSVDGVDVREVVLPEHDHPELIPRRERVAASDRPSAGGIQFAGPEIRAEAASQCEAAAES